MTREGPVGTAGLVGSSGSCGSYGEGRMGGTRRLGSMGTEIGRRCVRGMDRG